MIWVFTREVGRGCRGQVEDLIFLMMFCTSSDETSGKQRKEEERVERICAIFDVKTSMNLLHCSSVVAVSGGGVVV